jgi:hypothetical protein
LRSAVGSVSAAWPATGQSLPAVGGGRWLMRIGRAWKFASGDFDAGVVALAGFLIRGGIVVLAIPSVILPSLLGLASVLSVNALGIDGRPTGWLVATLVWLCAAGAIWLAVAALVGSAVDVWLIRSVAASDPDGVRRLQEFPDPGLWLDMAAVRIGCLLPLGAALVAAASPIYDAAYAELTSPTNLSDAIVVRVAVRAAAPLALVIFAWLGGETVSSIAVRRLAMGDGVIDALVGAVGQLIFRPVSSFLTFATTTFASVAGLAGVSAITGLAFGLVQDAARLGQPLALTISIGGLQASRDVRPIVFLASVVLLAFAWALALAVAGWASAWRSAAWTEETSAAMDRSMDGMPTE